MKRKWASVLVPSLLTFISAHVDAQESKIKLNTEGLQISGSFDFYYQSSPQGHAANPVTPSGPRILEGRFFDRHINQMTLNRAEISIQKMAGKVSFKTDIAVGEMVDQLSGGGSQSVTGTNPTNSAANESTRNVTQAVLSYSPTDRMALAAGKFYTHMGFEVTKAQDNYQYSRSYTFNYGIPFWHQGLSLNYKLIPGQVSTTFYVLNAWDGRIAQEQNQTSTVGANLNFTGFQDWVVNYNYLGGTEDNRGHHRELHELNASYNISPRMTFAADWIAGSQGSSQWSALTIYFKAALNDIYTLSPRFEVFDDSDRGFAISGLKQRIEVWTLSNNFNLGEGLEARLEFRSDKSDKKGFFKNKKGQDSDHQESYLAAVLYGF